MKASLASGVLLVLLSGFLLSTTAATDTTVQEEEEEEAAKCDWHPRGDIIRGSRPFTESGSSVAISKDGSIVAIEEYGNSHGPYKQNGHGTGRLRVLEWNSTANNYQETSVFTEGLSADLYMSSDGSIISTIGFNISNDGLTSEMDWIVQVYQKDEQEESSSIERRSSWKALGLAFSNDNGLGFYPSNHYLSKDGTILAISGGFEDDNNEDYEDTKSIHQVYRYNNDGNWQKLGQDIIVAAVMVQIALSETGDTLAIAAFQTNSDFSKNKVTARVYDWHEGYNTRNEWKQRGSNVSLSVADMRIPIFDIHLSSGASIMVLQAIETNGTETSNSGIMTAEARSFSNSEDNPGFLFVYEYHATSDRWELRATKLTTQDAWGYRTAVSEDSNTLVVAGIDNPDGWRTATGFLRIFQFVNGTYNLQQTIAPSPAGDGLAMNGRFLISGFVWANDSTGAVQVYEYYRSDGNHSDCNKWEFIPQNSSVESKMEEETSGVGTVRFRMCLVALFLLAGLAVLLA